MKACPRCNYRWVIAGRGPNFCYPKEPFGLDFYGPDTWCYQEQGRNDAARALEGDYYPQITDAIWRWDASPEL